MKNFCILKEIANDKEETKENKSITSLRDYIIGKYLKLIYICVYSSDPDDKDLLKDIQKFAYFYDAAKIESNYIETLTSDYLESIAGPVETDGKSEEDIKKALVNKYKSFMMARHSHLLENDAIYVKHTY